MFVYWLSFWWKHRNIYCERKRGFSLVLVGRMLDGVCIPLFREDPSVVVYFALCSSVQNTVFVGANAGGWSFVESFVDWDEMLFTQKRFIVPFCCLSIACAGAARPRLASLAGSCDKASIKECCFKYSAGRNFFLPNLSSYLGMS